MHQRSGAHWRCAPQCWKLALHGSGVRRRVRGRATRSPGVDMSAPFFELGAFGEGTSLLFAMLIGIAFGWVLERSGMGSARKLAGQFYLRDLTVFKVMFTAIVTAMLGVFWLGWLGFVDISRIYVPETFILPQLVGGLIFGAGFAIAGLCPGTSCVSAATGRADRSEERRVGKECRSRWSRER